jgi:hypothetical protein
MLIMIGVCVLNPILNFILYSVLKKKFNFEINVFFYGVGFVSTCFMVVYLIISTVDGGIVLSRSGNPVNEMIREAVLFYLFPVILLYYSYVILIKTNGEKDQKVISYLLMVITAICLATLTVFEMSKYQIPYASVFFLFYELYFAYCLIYKTHLFNLRLFAWYPFVFSWILFWCNFLLAISWSF